jgi:pimeloyl-ACP methyl ester carboxylesterase
LEPTGIAGVPAGFIARSISIDSSRIHLEEHPGREPLTVWLHHGVGSTRAWDPFLPAAADGRRSIAYDRRGFGRSTHRRAFSPALFEEDAVDLQALLTSLGGRPAHLIGHSDGGTVALLLAARHPELAVSVTVVAVHVRGDGVTVGTLEDMGPPSRWPPALQRSLIRSHGDDWISVAGAWHDLWTSPTFRKWSIVDELSSVRCPVMAVHDRRDALSPPLHAETITKRVAQAGVHWVDSGTHDPHRADVASFVATLRSFWEQAE